MRNEVFRCCRFVQWNQQRSCSNDLWNQVSSISGVMVRCLQKATRELIRHGKVSPVELIRACSHVTEYAIENQKNETPTACWDLSWIILEELAMSKQLLESLGSFNADLRFIVISWMNVTEHYRLCDIPNQYRMGTTRILTVLTEIALSIEASNATIIAEQLTEALGQFTVPMPMIGKAISCLYALCCTKAPTAKEGEDISIICFSQILEQCETQISRFLIEDGEPNDALVEVLQRQLFTIGEIAMLGFNKDEETVGI